MDNIIEQLKNVIGDIKSYKIKKRKIFKILGDNNVLFYHLNSLKILKNDFNYYKNIGYFLFLENGNYHKITIDYYHPNLYHIPINIENRFNIFLNLIKDHRTNIKLKKTLYSRVYSFMYSERGINGYY